MQTTVNYFCPTLYLFQSLNPSSSAWTQISKSILLMSSLQIFLTQGSFSEASPLLVLRFFSPTLWTVFPSLCLYSARLAISLSAIQAGFILDSKFCTCGPLAKNAYIYVLCLLWSLSENFFLPSQALVTHLAELSGWSHSILVCQNCVDIYRKMFFFKWFLLFFLKFLFIEF